MNRNKVIAICIALLPAAIAAFCRAQPPAPQTPDPQASASADKIRQNIEETLKLISELKAPSSSDVAAYQKLLDESKRHVGQLSEQQKAQYVLFQGWVSYFQNDLPKAYTSSAAACRFDPANPDAWASQAAFALLLNKKPMTPRPQRPAQRQKTKPQDPMMNMPGVYPADAYTQQKSILNFDIRQLRVDLLEQKVKPFSLDCLNGTTFDWQPGSEILCALYWQKFTDEKTPAEPNTPSAAGQTDRTPRRTQTPPPVYDLPPEGSMPPMFEQGFAPGLGYGQQYPLDAQTAACNRIIQASWLGQKRFFKFVAVNIDNSRYKAEIINEIFKHPWPSALALAADQKPDSLPVKPDSATTPLLIIADSAGSVRYAGPADSFIVPMLLAHLASGRLPAAAATTQPNTYALPAEPNVPAKSPLPPVPMPAPAVNQPEQNPQQAVGVDDSKLAEEEKFEAEKLLTYTRDLFMKLAKKRGLTYTQGVDFCRQLMKKYPGTSYAQQARELLRQVPENQRQRYGITDQELGL